MKNITLSIPAPCSASWSSFTPTHNGGFCGSCSTNVVDFTKMSEAEVIAYLKNHSSACGRFRNDQLKTYTLLQSPQLRTGSTLLKAGLLSLLVVTLGQSALARPIENPKAETSQYIAEKKQAPNVHPDYVVRGRVIFEDDNTPLAGVNVYLKDMTTAGVATGVDVRFEFPRKLKEGDVLVFSFIGMATKEYVVTAQAQENIEIRMTYDTCVVMGKVAMNEEYQEPSRLTKWWSKIKNVF
jgi:hypothetical protein